MEFCTRTTNSGFNNFASFFSESDVEVRHLDKLVQGRAKATGYHSAANVDEINKRINNKVDAEMVNFAASFKALLDAAALNTDTVAAQAGNNETTPNVADKLPSSSNQDAILAALKAISDLLDQ